MTAPDIGRSVNVPEQPTTSPTATPIEAIVHVDAKMTRRARGYMWLTAAPAFGNAIFCFFGRATFASPTAGASYAYAGRTAPFWMWGIAFMLVALAAAGGAISGNEHVARAGLIGSGALLCAWAAFFSVAFAVGVAGPTGVIMWGTLGIKDLIMCRVPLRTPFEAITRRYSIAPKG